MVLTDAEIEREQRMLTELRAMRRVPHSLSTLSKKRLRIPRADDDNPFCAERQVTDASSLARFNKVFASFRAHVDYIKRDRIRSCMRRRPRLGKHTLATTRMYLTRCL